MMSPNEGLLTFAFGDNKYIEMAQALSMSYRRHSPSRPIAIVTDQGNVARLAPHYDVVIPYNPANGRGVVQKLSIDLYTPFKKTLFVDSDCLFYKNPELVWNTYAQDTFCVRGWRYLTGATEYEQKRPYEWLDNVDKFLNLVGIKRLPHFNSGVLYFEDSDRAHQVFLHARDIYGNRENLGFIKFKGAPIADEPALAVGMERVGIEMLPWDPINGMETSIGMQTSKLNVLTGNSTFIKNGELRNPALIHFNVNAQYSRAYNREKFRLFYEGRRLQPLAAEVLSLTKWIEVLPKRVLEAIVARYEWRSRRSAKGFV